jgi:gamma-glutamylcysteine synthetase
MPTIETKTQLIDYFNQGAKVKDQLLIGVEHEKLLFSGK